MANKLNHAVKAILNSYPIFPQGQEKNGYFLTSHILLCKAERGDWKSIKHFLTYLLKDEEMSKNFNIALKKAMVTHLTPLEEQDGYLMLAYLLLDQAYNYNGKALKFLFDYLAAEEDDEEEDEPLPAKTPALPKKQRQERVIDGPIIMGTLPDLSLLKTADNPAGEPAGYKRS
ncbi:MAG: hypothetical protein FWE37_04140 [Spirochaetaceae bacterium]|nr:hypothetical protein [Spirochaetaceae bacterium]